MKRILILFVLIAVTLYSCNTMEIEETISETMSEMEVNLAENDPHLKKFLKDYDFFNAKVIDLGNSYLIDNCHSVEKEVLWNGGYFLNGDPNAHAVRNSLVNSSPFNFRTIRIRVDDNTMPTSGVHDWRPEIQQAIADLNSVRNMRLNFLFVSSGSYDILVRREPITNSFGQILTNVVADARFPQSGNPGNLIRINTGFSFGLNSGMKRRNMVHEIGHAIGFRHTNWTQLGESTSGGANTIAATYSQDPQSVMNGATALEVWSGFSLNDILAFRTVYPYNDQERPLYTFFRNVPNYSGIVRHWWTGNWSEPNTQFLPRGVTGFMFNSAQVGTTPLYRYYSPGMDSFFLSTNSNLNDPGFPTSTIVGHVYNSPAPGRIPVYVWWNNNEAHFFTTNQNDSSTSGPGWIGGSIAFYVNGWF